MTTVEILHAPKAAGAVKGAVAAGGGSVTGEVPGSLVQTAVPDGAADALATVPGVLQVRPPVDINVVPDAAPILQAGSVNSESVAKTLAGSWHSQGLTGAGVNVAVVDLFDGPALDSAVASGNLSGINFTTDAFCMSSGAECRIRDDPTPVPVVGGSLHGVAVAEIVHDMAPGAKLYYVTAVTTTDLRAAVDWMASKGVTVVNRSMGAPLDGPGNGTGPLADVAAYAASRGITWVNSAGNAANGGYWRGGWSDPDGDRFLNFSGGDEFLEVNVFPCAVALGFRWSDWGAPTTRTDYDVYIDVDRNGIINDQDLGWETNQRDGSPPIEMAGGILGNCAGGGQALSIAVRLFDVGAGTGGDVLELLTNGAQLEYSSMAFGATQPISDSSNPGVLSVGAIDPWQGTGLANYSSQGPTNDGRVKPDISAPSGLSTVTYGATNFNGTSAAAPVVAGAAALVVQSGLAAGPHTVRAFLTAASTERGAAGPDNAFGSGEVSMPSRPPAGWERSRFVPVSPFRLADTRSGQGAPAGKIQPFNVVKLSALGQGGVPASGVSAVVLNMTATETAGSGYLQVYPHAWGVIGGSSNLNVDGAGQTIANLVVVPVGADGKIAVYDFAGSHVVADVFGYFVEDTSSREGRFVGLTPSRILDTRAGLGAPAGIVPASGVVDVQVRGQAGVPANGASAVVLNVTATEAVIPGWVQALPGGSAQFGQWSNLNLARGGQTIANLVIVPLDATGRVRLFTLGASHLIADVMGYITNTAAPASSAGLFTPIRPGRIRDTRTEGARVGPQGRITVSNPLAGTNPSALLLNVTATETLGAGYLQVYPTGAPVEQASSNVNIERAGQTIPNAAIATLSAGDQFNVFSLSSTHVVLDTSGWFS